MHKTQIIVLSPPSPQGRVKFIDPLTKFAFAANATLSIFSDAV